MQVVGSSLHPPFLIIESEMDPQDLEDSPKAPPAEDGELPASLLEAKKQRKQADEDARLLANRIALLKQEEQKAWKKIEDTRKRAKEIMDMRARNLELQRQREEARKLKEEEEQRRILETKARIEAGKSAKQTVMDQRAQKAFGEALGVKQLKSQNREAIHRQKEDDLSKNKEVSRTIKEQERISKERREQMEEEKRQKARVELERKIRDETRMRQEREERIARMEQEEMELIQRLTNTQQLQKSAYEDLEMALSGQIDPPEAMASQSPKE